MDDWLFGIKGLLCFTGVILLVVHMNRRASGVLSMGRRWRYLALLAGALAVGYSSLELVAKGLDFKPRHAGGLAFAVLLNIAMLISLHEDRNCEDPGDIDCR